MPKHRQGKYKDTHGRKKGIDRQKALQHKKNRNAGLTEKQAAHIATFAKQK